MDKSQLLMRGRFLIAGGLHKELGICHEEEKQGGSRHSSKP